MKNNKKCRFVWFLFAVILIVLSTYFAICHWQNDKLKTWVGEYEYRELSEYNQTKEYFIDVYEEMDQYFADICIVDNQTVQNVKASLKGNKEFIQLNFYSYLSDHNDGEYNIGDHLLDMVRQGPKILIRWEKIKGFSKEGGFLISQQSTIENSLSQTFAENDTHVFYIKQNQLFSQSKTDSSVCKIKTDDLVNTLCLYQEHLYYSTRHEIYQTDLDGSNQIMIWDTSKLHIDYEVFDIVGFHIYKDVLYIQNTGISMLAFDLKSKQTESFVKDYSSGAFLDDYFYYVDHVEKTFSIYAKDLTTKEVHLIRGDGKMFFDGKENLYDGVAAFEGELYYSKRFPARLYRYNMHGEDELLAEFAATGNGEFVHIASRDNGLYIEFGEKIYQYNNPEK